MVRHCMDLGLGEMGVRWWRVDRFSPGGEGRDGGFRDRVVSRGRERKGEERTWGKKEVWVFSLMRDLFRGFEDDNPIYSYSLSCG